MINLILSLVIGALAWVGSVFIFDSVWSGILPFIVFTIVALIIFNRNTAKKVSVIMNKGQNMIQDAVKIKDEKARTKRFEASIEQLKKAYQYSNYQLFLKQQLNAQIGSLYYIQQKFTEAEPYLADSFIQPGTARTMLACLLFKKWQKEKDDAKKKELENQMNIAFELATKIDKRTPLLWNVRAWCLNEMGKRNEAIKILNDCLVINSGDKPTLDNLDVLKNAKSDKKAKLKMNVYNEQWYQFLLEMPSQQMIMMSPFSKRAMFGKPR